MSTCWVCLCCGVRIEPQNGSRRRHVWPFLTTSGHVPVLGAKAHVSCALPSIGLLSFTLQDGVMGDVFLCHRVNEGSYLEEMHVDVHLVTIRTLDYLVRRDCFTLNLPLMPMPLRRDMPLPRLFVVMHVTVTYVAMPLEAQFSMARTEGRKVGLTRPLGSGLRGRAARDFPLFDDPWPLAPESLSSES